MSGHTSTAADAPAAGWTKYASQVPSGVAMATSASVVLAPASAGAPAGAAALPDPAGAGDVAGSGGAHPRGRSDARPAPSVREPKARLAMSSRRGGWLTMSSKESSSHMRASQHAPGRRNKPERGVTGVPPWGLYTLAWLPWCHARGDGGAAGAKDARIDADGCRSGR